MAGYIGSKAVSVNTTSATISDDLAVGDDLTVTDDATIGGTALVTGVLTTTAATVFNGGFAANAGSTISTADNTAQLTLISTDADGSSGPKLTMFRNSGSPADGDALGIIDFTGEDSNGDETRYVAMFARPTDVTNGDEFGKFQIIVATDGVDKDYFHIDAGTKSSGSLVNGEIVFNEDSQDIDFRVESDGNANMLFVDGGENRIGIGTNAPATDVHIQKSSATAILRLHRTGATNAANAALGQLEFFNADGTGDGPNVTSKIVGSTFTSTGAGGNLEFYTHDSSESGGEGSDPVQRVKIDGVGNVGIGTTAINARLDIDGAGGSPATSGTTQGGVVRIRNADNNNCLDMGQIAGSPYGSWIQATDVTDLSAKNPLYLNLNGGSVGLGTTAVESWTLNVAGTNFSSGGGLAVAAVRDLTAYDTSDNGAGITFQGIYNSGGSYTNFATIQAGKLNNTDGHYSTYLRFLTRSNGASQAEAVRIDEAGTLLVGTTAKVNDGLQVNKFNGTSHNGLVLKTTRSATGTTFIAFVNSAGNFCGSVSQNGTTTVAFNTSSDQRLKENIADSDDSGSTIDAIKVRKFDWIDGGVHEKYGFIAQELKTVVPEAVSSLGLAAEDDPMLGVDQSKLIALAIKEIQLLRVRVAELETKVTALEG